MLTLSHFNINLGFDCECEETVRAFYAAEGENFSQVISLVFPSFRYVEVFENEYC